MTGNQFMGITRLIMEQVKRALEITPDNKELWKLLGIMQMLDNILSTFKRGRAIIFTVETVGFLVCKGYKQVIRSRDDRFRKKPNGNLFLMGSINDC